MKYVSENLPQFKDDNFFVKVFESTQAVSEVEEEMTPEEKAKVAAELERQGLAVVKKLEKNFSAFKTSAGVDWKLYRDFWNDQKTPKEVNAEGMFYKMYNSKYVVGVVKTDDGVAQLVVWNSEIEDGFDDHEVFKCFSPVAIKAFVDFYKNTYEAAFRNIISKQKEVMEKNKADVLRKEQEEKKIKEKSKVDAFLKESKSEDTINEDYASILDYFKNMWSQDDDVVRAILDDEYLTQKYGDLIDVDYNWDNMSEKQLLDLWDDWSSDERMLDDKVDVNESNTKGQKKAPKPLTVPDKSVKKTKDKNKKK